MSFREVLDLALQLPGEDRAALVGELLLGLDPQPPDPDCESAWNAEILARMERVERGDYTATERREALARIRRSLHGAAE